MHFCADEAAIIASLFAFVPLWYSQIKTFIIHKIYHKPKDCDKCNDSENNEK